MRPPLNTPTSGPTADASAPALAPNLPAEILRDRKKSRILAFVIAFLMALLYSPCIFAYVLVMTLAPQTADTNVAAATPSTTSGTSSTSGTDWLCSPASILILWCLFLVVTTWLNPVSRFWRGACYIVCVLGTALYAFSITEPLGKGEWNSVLFMVGMSGVGLAAIAALWKLGSLDKLEASLEYRTTPAAIAAEIAAEQEQDDDTTEPGWDEGAPPAHR